MLKLHAVYARTANAESTAAITLPIPIPLESTGAAPDLLDEEEEAAEESTELAV